MAKQAFTLRPVRKADARAFLPMAVQYFRTLNPLFTPHHDWTRSYLPNLLADRSLTLQWIALPGGRRAGFVLSAVEPHRFLPRRRGVIYELYVRPEFRCLGLGSCVAARVIRQLRGLHVAKIELEVAVGNHRAERFWKALGFRKMAARYTLT